MTAITAAKPASPPFRLLRMAHPMRGRLLLAVLAGAVGCGCGVALLAVSGFLLARASQHPNIVAISVAVVLVRVFSVGRGLLRYLELLDEPTAHLDPDNRRALTADLLAATAGRSTLLITHHLDGLDQVDEIVVLDHGRVAERGTHAELIRSGGAYQRLREASR
jgi:ABC-type transport system involved in cytochrome bd biosynthesis fused ATPase/permease subunit